MISTIFFYRLQRVMICMPKKKLQVFYLFLFIREMTVRSMRMEAFARSGKHSTHMSLLIVNYCNLCKFGEKRQDKNVIK